MFGALPRGTVCCGEIYSPVVSCACPIRLASPSTDKILSPLSPNIMISYSAAKRLLHSLAAGRCPCLRLFPERADLCERLHQFDDDGEIFSACTAKLSRVDLKSCCRGRHGHS